MNYRGDARPVVFADHEEAFPHVLVRRDVNGYGGAAGWRRVGCLAVETDNIVKSSGKPPHDGIANRSVGARNDDNPISRFGSCLWYRHVCSDVIFPFGDDGRRDECRASFNIRMTGSSRSWS